MRSILIVLLCAPALLAAAAGRNRPLTGNGRYPRPAVSLNRTHEGRDVGPTRGRRREVRG